VEGAEAGAGSNRAAQAAAMAPAPRPDDCSSSGNALRMRIQHCNRHSLLIDFRASERTHSRGLSKWLEMPVQGLSEVSVEILMSEIIQLCAMCESATSCT
jgi:hypothetical protein